MEDARYIPLYTPGEAALYTGLSTTTVRRWALGDKNRPPILKKRATDQHSLTFLDLVELDLVGRLRREGVPLKEIEALYRAFLAVDAVENPLSCSQEIYRFGNRLVSVDHENETAHELTRGQYNFFEIVLEFGRKLDFDQDKRAIRFYPDEERAVVIDPSIRCGTPTLKDTRVDTSAVYELFRAEDDDAEAVASWYDLPVASVRAAVAWETQLRNQAA